MKRYTISELRDAILSRGVRPGDVGHVAGIWLLLSERFRHVADTEQAKADLRNLRETGDEIGRVFRDFLCRELSRHETEIAKLDALVVMYPGAFVAKARSIDKGWLSTEV